MKFVLQSKTKQNKSTEIFPPLILKPTCMYMLRCIAGSVADPDQVVSGSGSNQIVWIWIQFRIRIQP